MLEIPQQIADSSPGSLAGYAVAALTAIGVMFHKLTKNWNETSAGNQIVTTLREEMKRLADQNTLLAKQLNEYQKELIDLRKLLSSREDRINQLEVEVNVLKRAMPTTVTTTTITTN